MKRVNIFECFPNNRLLKSIHSMILVSFTLVSVLLTLLLSIVLYRQFSGHLTKNAMESTEQQLRQTVVSLEDYLVSMRRISDAMYYDVIKDKDLQDSSVSDEMNLMYEANRDDLVSIALFSGGGELISAAPVANMKKSITVPEQSWFQDAQSQVENLHFTTAHVQNLFDDPSYRYHWVISLSRVVELNHAGKPESGVLLVDMNYSTIERILKRLNDYSTGQYFYLSDSTGKIIYHPQQMQIYNGIYAENNAAIPDYVDGVHREQFRGEKRMVILDTVGYTGWKLVSVIPENHHFFGIDNMRYFVVMLAAVTILFLLLLNQVLSLQISYPLLRLNESIRGIEQGNLNEEEIYVGGSMEVEHLGQTLRQSIHRINQLMEDIVVEQEEKRKSEMDALQSQINPHFLYNTLDSIVWMIEGGHNDNAASMVTQLASLLRISLSRGKNIIPIQQELLHARNYMNIQKVRYKNAFRVDFDIDPEIEKYLSVKLILQPILENAIYYGVEGMDGDGEIRVEGRISEAEETESAESVHTKDAEADVGNEDRTEARKPREICISIIDNGFGMPESVVESLLKEDEESRRKAPKHGSGVGVINVHKRIQLRFGAEYGLRFFSELDEGTRVELHLPAVEDTEENRKLLEEGHYLRGGRHERK